MGRSGDIVQLFLCRTAQGRGARACARGKYEGSFSESWSDPFIGAGSRLSVDGQALLGYRTTLLGGQALLRIGYHALYQDYQHHGFRWDVTQDEPIAGVSATF